MSECGTMATNANPSCQMATFMMLHVASDGAYCIWHEGFAVTGRSLYTDLKASNVLIESLEYIGILTKEENGMDPIQLDHDFVCFVTDFECSIGVVGIAYWRVPDFEGFEELDGAHHP